MDTTGQITANVIFVGQLVINAQDLKIVPNVMDPTF